MGHNMSYITGVNSPEYLCMDFHTCEYVFKGGKNKGNYCSNTAYHDVVGCFCKQHQTIMSKKMTTSVKKDYKKCIAILKSGKRKGDVCDGKISVETSEYCKRHTSK